MLELALALDRIGHRVTVACLDYEPGTEHRRAGSQVEIRAVREGGVRPPAGRLGELTRLWREMPRVARAVPADAEVINAHETFALRAGRIAARRLGVPLVWTRNDETLFERAAVPDETVFGSSGLISRAGRGLLGLPYLRDARAAGAIVVLDQRNARMVERSYGRRATIVRSGPARFFFDPPPRAVARERLGVSERVFLAVGAGILFPHRRFEDLIEAVALLEGAQPVEALIVGSDHADPGYADSLERMAGELGVTDTVAIRRQGVSDDELRHTYAAADVFVFPNERQTWGLAPLEALAGGTPAIVSSGAGVHEVLEGRPGVTVVPPRQPSAIADALIAIRTRGRTDLDETIDWIRRELSDERYARRMAELFAELRPEREPQPG
jgi:glycosyltransferase involved in cell wall biosynthesis